MAMACRVHVLLPNTPEGQLQSCPQSTMTVPSMDQRDDQANSTAHWDFHIPRIQLRWALIALTHTPSLSFVILTI